MAKTEETERNEVRERILIAAARLVETDGPDAATTRAVAAAAAVQAPTIYRFFGDKRGLLDAVAEHAVATYVARKASRKPHPDPVEDLRRGWDTHVAFGVEHPGVVAIMSRETRPGEPSPATAAGLEVLRAKVKRVAAAGRLRVSEARAVALLQSVGNGVMQTLIQQAPDARDRRLSDLARDAVISTICDASVASAAPGVRGAAIALGATLDETKVLTRGERQLLGELLARIAEG